MSGMLTRYYRSTRSPRSRTLIPVLLAVVLLAVGAMPVVGDGIWHGEYFNNRNLAGGPYFVRTDEAIDFDWGMDAAQHHSIEQVMHPVESAAPTINFDLFDRFPAHKSGEQPCQTQNMIQVTMGQQYAVESFKTNART